MKKIKIVLHEYPFEYYGSKVIDFICFIGSKTRDFVCFIGSKLPIDIEIQ